VVDDVLATGGTANATLDLLGRCGARVCGAAFLLELEALEGRQVLHDTMMKKTLVKEPSAEGFVVHTLLQYS